METVLTVLGGLGIFLVALLWFTKGISNDAQRRKDMADEAYARANKNRRKADHMLDDPDYRRRLFDEDNKN